MGRLDEAFHRYFAALDRSGGEDRCYLCRRTPAEVKAFFGFDEDGFAIDAESYGLEDVVLEKADIMSYRGTRPVCAVCQLNFETLFAMDEGPTLDALLREMRERRDELWPQGDE